MIPRVAWLAVGALTSAIVARHVPGPAWALPLVLAAMAAVLRPGARVATVAFALGAVLVVLRIAAGVLLAPPVTIVPLVDGDRQWVAEVVSLGTPGDGQQRAFLDVTPSGVDAPGGPAAASVRIYAKLPRYPEVAPGDRIQFRGALEAVPPGPGFAEYLVRNGAVATCSIRTFSAAAAPQDAMGALEHARRDGADLLARVLPAHEAGLAAGMLIGLRDRVDRTVAADFTASGLSHVVAISGWNIALVGAVIAACLRRLPRRPRSLVMVLAIAAYTVAAGGSASVVRAALMGAVVLVARESGRRGAAPVALGIASAALVLVDPAMVDDAGFTLSVAATAGLLAWATPLTATLRRRTPRRVPGWLIETLGVSLAAQAATLPLVLLDFGRLSLIAPLANLLVAPLVAPAMAAGTVALLAGGVVALGAPAILGTVAATGGWAALGSIIAIAHAAASVPFASIEVGTPWNMAGAAVAAAGLAVFGTERGRTAARRARMRAGSILARVRAGPPAGAARTGSTDGHRRTTGDLGSASPTPRRTPLDARASRARRTALVAISGSVGILVLTIVVAAARPDGRLRITVLDVGQGDAVLLEGPRGGRMLLDSGPDPDRLVAALDARLPAWDRRIDLVVLTHPHEDHVAGLALLLERYGIAAVAENGMVGAGPGDAAYRRELKREGRPTAILAAGDQVTLDGLSLAVLWPPRGSLPARAPSVGRQINDSSLVFDLHFGDRRFLLTGDVEDDVDPRLLAAGIGDGERLDFLKVPHHGSGTATSDGLVAALRPRIAAVSVGARNDYGHPSPKTIARLETAGAAVLRTDTDGSITVTSDGRDLQVTAGSRRLAFVPPDIATGMPGPPPRISRWASRPVSRASTCCAASSRPAGSSRTASLSQRSQPSWPPDSMPPGSPSTARSSKLPRCCTTSTSCSIPTTRCDPSATATAALAGWSETATRSWPARSPPTPSRGSATPSDTPSGRPSRTARAVSSCTPTSEPASASSRSPPASTGWSAATRRTSPPSGWPARALSAWNARCARPRPSDPRTSGAFPGSP